MAHPVSPIFRVKYACDSSRSRYYRNHDRIQDQETVPGARDLPRGGAVQSKHYLRYRYGQGVYSWKNSQRLCTLNLFLGGMITNSADLLSVQYKEMLLQLRKPWSGILLFGQHRENHERYNYNLKFPELIRQFCVLHWEEIATKSTYLCRLCNVHAKSLLLFLAENIAQILRA